MPLLQLSDGTWRLDSPFDGVGSLTLSGSGFTSEGAVQIVYNYGGGQYERFVQANSSGAFTVTEHSIFCGDIPGMPGVGVIVTAFDISLGVNTTGRYRTPC